VDLRGGTILVELHGITLALAEQVQEEMDKIETALLTQIVEVQDTYQILLDQTTPTLLELVEDHTHQEGRELILVISDLEATADKTKVAEEYKGLLL
jgi:hypothetical protein